MACGALQDTMREVGWRDRGDRLRRALVDYVTSPDVGGSADMPVGLVVRVLQRTDVQHIAAVTGLSRVEATVFAMGFEEAARRLAAREPLLHTTVAAASRTHRVHSCTSS
jgi:hypothetical protein